MANKTKTRTTKPTKHTQVGQSKKTAGSVKNTKVEKDKKVKVQRVEHFITIRLKNGKGVEPATDAKLKKWIKGALGQQAYGTIVVSEIETVDLGKKEKKEKEKADRLFKELLNSEEKLPEPIGQEELEENLEKALERAAQETEEENSDFPVSGVAEAMNPATVTNPSSDIQKDAVQDEFNNGLSSSTEIPNTSSYDSQEELEKAYDNTFGNGEK